MPANISRNQVRIFKRTRRRVTDRFILSLKRLLVNDLPDISQTKNIPAAQKCLLAIAGLSALLAVTGNWQCWINITFTAIIAFLSITKKYCNSFKKIARAGRTGLAFMNNKIKCLYSEKKLIPTYSHRKNIQKLFWPLLH